MNTNGNHARPPAPPSEMPLTLVATSAPRGLKTVQFDQSVVLQQSPRWMIWILGTLVSFTAGGIAWACLAQMEQAIPATGKLEPLGIVKEVQSPVNGVIRTLQVVEGQHVKKGDVLLRLDPTAMRAQEKTLKQIRSSLQQENEFYLSTLAGRSDLGLGVATNVRLQKELLNLVASRKALVAENEFYRVQMGEARLLNTEQNQRLAYSREELNTRLRAGALEGDQLERQLQQARIQRENAQKTLKINQTILKDLEPLVQEGGIDRVRFLKQQQEVGTNEADVARYSQEEARLHLAMAQAKEKVQNAKAATFKDTLTNIATNDKRIAEIDSQLTKAVVENNKRISEIDSQLSQAQVTLDYEQVRAPVDGVVFDLKPSAAGYVATLGQPLLKLVPEDNLIAKVYITNRDIGFIHEGMQADVRIDSFPYSEFGDIKGTLTRIGSDALPPDQIRQYYTFPAKIRLDRQTLLISGKQVQLQSGMSVNVNIKLRKRSVMSIFTDLFSQSIESMKFVR
jgi:hemolysin D